MADDFDYSSVSPQRAAELRREREILRRAGEKLRRNPERARAFLLKYGFITPDNQLSPQYR